LKALTFESVKDFKTGNPFFLICIAYLGIDFKETNGGIGSLAS
jgi:hypothetical protein